MPYSYRIWLLLLAALTIL
ncbi:hypothetical protein LI171_00735 [Emergencia timonensis]|nr:hypothetical protein [Emergencia timonensis]